MINYDFNTILGTLYKLFFQLQSLSYILTPTSLFLQPNAGKPDNNNHKRDSRATPRGMAKNENII